MKRKKIRLNWKDRVMLFKIKRLTKKLESTVKKPSTKDHLKRHRVIRELQQAVAKQDEYFKSKVEEAWKTLGIGKFHPCKYFFRTFELLIARQKNLLSTDSKEDLLKKLRRN